MSDCPRIGKLFGGCKFSPRYDLTTPTPQQLATLSAPILTCEIEALSDRRYVADVCERCGKTIERDSHDGQGRGGGNVAPEAA